MTTRELVALLERAQTLGGPISLSTEDNVWCALINHGADEADICGPGLDWRDEWLLIGAFTLDAEQRGWRTKLHAGGGGIGLPAKAGFTLYLDTEHFRYVGRDNAPTLLEAVLRAWIAARESEEG